MEEALRFFRAYEVWIYLLLAVGGLFYARKFILAWQELRDAAFGLERDHAQARLNQAASILVLLLAMAITEVVLVSFIAPAVPGAVPLPTSTLNSAGNSHHDAAARPAGNQRRARAPGDNSHPPPGSNGTNRLYPRADRDPRAVRWQ